MIGAALDQLDLTAMLAELRNQETKGHTAESDAERPLGTFSDVARRLSGELHDVLLAGDRQNLDVAYRRAARIAAFGLSMQRRIRLEQQRRQKGTTNDGTD